MQQIRGTLWQENYLRQDCLQLYPNEIEPAFRFAPASLTKDFEDHRSVFFLQSDIGCHPGTYSKTWHSKHAQLRGMDFLALSVLMKTQNQLLPLPAHQNSFSRMLRRQVPWYIEMNCLPFLPVEKWSWFAPKQSPANYCRWLCLPLPMPFHN